MLERFVTYGSLVLIVGALLCSAFKLNRQPRLWVLRYRAWLKRATLFQRAATQTAGFAIGYLLWGGVIVVLSRVHLLAPELDSPILRSPVFWVLMAICSGLWMLVFAMLSDRPPRDEPQDWLLWAKDAKSGSETASNGTRVNAGDSEQLVR